MECCEQEGDLLVLVRISVPWCADLGCPRRHPSVSAMPVLSLLVCHASPCTSTRCCKRLSAPIFPFDVPQCPHTNTPGTISGPCFMLQAPTWAPRTGSANASSRQLPSATRAPCSQYPPQLCAQSFVMKKHRLMGLHAHQWLQNA
jgi:hypothetical protein